jgi:cysteine desulfurase
MTLPRIYLDNNATTRLDPRVAETLLLALQQRYANPASQHAEGRQARMAMEAAVATILQAVDGRQTGMAADRILMTSGGTEANNLAIAGLLEQRSGELVVSAIEHPSILGMAEHLARAHGRQVRYLPVQKNGQVCLDTWEEWLDLHRRSSERRMALVSVMLANNETGVLQPISRIIRDCRAEGILFHTDAVQVAGKMPLSFRQLDVDAMTITAHKLHGPVGIAGLILRHDVRLSPQAFGGFQQAALRPGTEAVALTVGMAAALALSQAELQERQQRMQGLRDRLEQSLLAGVIPPTVIGGASPRLPHTLSLAFRGFNRQALQMALDRHGLACSTGSACASGSSQPSHVLQAMGLESDLVEGAIRLSLSGETTEAEVVAAVERIERVVGALKPRC